MPPSLRPIWVLGAGAAVVTVAMVTSRGGLAGSKASADSVDDVGAINATPPAASIGGEPLVAPAPVSSPAQLPPLAAPPAPPAPRPISGSLVGDAALAGEIDLDRMTLAGDHYEVPISGNRTAILTLDPTIQQAAEKTLARAKAPMGAIAVVDTDGRVLALAGRKTTDPKGGKDGISDWHLALGSWAPAASIFKIVSASALLEAGVEPSDKVCFHGGLRSVTESNLVDGKNDSRCEDLTYAVAYSQNAIIAKLAHAHLDPDKLGAMAQRLGVSGALPAFALPGDAGAVDMPASNDVEFARTAAGFANTKLSAMGGALLADAIATRGESVTPRIVEAVMDHGKRIELSSAPPRRAISDDTAAQVGHMMEETCARGTAAKAFHGKRDDLPGGVRVAGKTGTLAKSDPIFLEYSWFVGYAPADRPTMSIAVVLGNAESWWMKGHQAARMVLAAALGRHTTVADR
ncbi:MAG TPA: penicillin-binding transpeptidase domain-containing protein [Kofleriaceae bacterium]|nr:penicillin-binding transpeptidase domain-containing protein [Kofleriaceae bacterium]